jgi:type IV secretion system protein VirD4
MRKKQYEASYAGYVYPKLNTGWTATEEVKRRLKKVDLSGQTAIEAGGMPIISDGKTAYIDADDGHTAVIACSGMKKSICCFMPLIITLARAGENLFLTDPKGELFSRTAGFLKSLGYNVLCLDFRTMDKDCFNILHYPAAVYRSGDKDKGLCLLSDLINALAEEQRQRANDPFWPDSGALWMNGTGAVMLDAFPKLEQINILNWADFNVRSSASIIEERLLQAMPNNTAKAALKQCLSAAENTFKSILITASSFLAMFNQNPKLAAMLSHSTFTLEDLTKPKTALFLVTNDTTSTADAILGMIVAQIQTFLIEKAYHSPNGKLDIRMNFVLEEFASIPLPNMDKALATHRSRNIRYYLCVQSMALLKERYKNPEKLLSNCSATLYLGSTELELLKDLEAKLGMTRITPDGSQKPLCSQAELMMLEKAWDHKEAIYMNLSEGIRYCTMLPSIESYSISGHPLPPYHRDPPAIETYTVAEFADDIARKRIRAPFVPESEKRLSSRENSTKRPRSQPSDVSSSSDPNHEAEMWKMFDELFGTSND